MFSVKSMMRSAGAVGGALVLLASGASAAHADPTFSPTGPVVWKASTTNPITLKIGGGTQPWQNRTCLPGATAGTGSVANVPARITGLTLPAGSLTCTDGTGATFQTTISLINQAFLTNSGGGYFGTFAVTSYNGMSINDVGPPGTGLVAQNGLGFPAQFVNGTTAINGANPSTLTIVNRPVGNVRDTLHSPGVISTIYVSGTFSVGTATSAVTVAP